LNSGGRSFATFSFYWHLNFVINNIIAFFLDNNAFNLQLIPIETSDDVLTMQGICVCADWRSRPRRHPQSLKNIDDAFDCHIEVMVVY
jgi:hypothetical protein